MAHGTLDQLCADLAVLVVGCAQVDVHGLAPDGARLVGVGLQQDLLLGAEPGALPENDTSDDILVQIFQGQQTGWNRRLAGIGLRQSPTKDSFFDVFTTIEVQASGTTANLLAVWGAAADTVFAVGTDGVILRYDGEAWSAQESGTGETLRGVWGFASDDVYAVGNAGTLLHYDGSAWTSRQSPTSRTLRAVWGDNEGQLYLVGDWNTVLRFGL